MCKTLNDVNRNQKAVIKKINVKGPVRRKLMDMGITAGEVITVRKTAPLGDPVEISIRGYELSLRKKEAEKIIVE